MYYAHFHFLCPEEKLESYVQTTAGYLKIALPDGQFSDQDRC
jgi:hypothetical protein